MSSTSLCFITETEQSRKYSVCSHFSLAGAGSCDSAYDNDILIQPISGQNMQPVNSGDLLMTIEMKLRGNNVEVRLEVRSM